MYYQTNEEVLANTWTDSQRWATAGDIAETRPADLFLASCSVIHHISLWWILFYKISCAAPLLNQQLVSAQTKSEGTSSLITTGPINEASLPPSAQPLLPRIKGTETGAAGNPSQTHWVAHIIHCLSIMKPGIPAPNMCNLLRIILGEML